jgi:hypothetical protein
MRTKLKLFSDGGDCGSKKCETPLWWGLAESSGTRVVEAEAASARCCYKFCYHSSQKASFPSTLTGRTLR